MTDFSSLPQNLPRPEDDGAGDHLLGLLVPNMELPTTNGDVLNLSRIPSPWLVLYIYPMTGRPNVALPDGWDQIPGARGCTPQSCAFRDHSEALGKLGAIVVGLSVQDSLYQAEMVSRLHLPYSVVSDIDRCFGDALNLPRMQVVMPDGTQTELYKRLTLIASEGVIRHVMYPVFPPDQNPAEVERWLKNA